LKEMMDNYITIQEGIWKFYELRDELFSNTKLLDTLDRPPMFPEWQDEVVYELYKSNYDWCNSIPVLKAIRKLFISEKNKEFDTPYYWQEKKWYVEDFIGEDLRDEDYFLMTDDTMEWYKFHIEFIGKYAYDNEVSMIDKRIEELSA